MTSPFLRNRSHKLAHQVGAAIAATGKPAQPAEDTEAGQEYAVLRVALHEDLRQLSDVSSVDARRPMKAQMALRYAPWIEGILSADAPVQDEILVTNMIWAIDAGNYASALLLAGFVLRHGLALPERYNRKPACLVAEEFAEAALTGGAVDHTQLLQVEALTAGADMPDQARAKLMKAIGLGWAAKAEAFDASDDSAPAGGRAAYVDQALIALRRALALDKAVGVKKRIEQLERLARDLAPPATEDTPPADQATPPAPAKPKRAAKPKAAPAKRGRPRKSPAK